MLRGTQCFSRGGTNGNCCWEVKLWVWEAVRMRTGKSTTNAVMVWTADRSCWCGADTNILSAPSLVRTQMITIRFPGWISGRIVSLQQDTGIRKLLSNGNRIRIRISETLLSIFQGFRLWKKLHIAQSFIRYLQKHLFSLLRHDSESVICLWCNLCTVV